MGVVSVDVSGVRLIVIACRSPQHTGLICALKTIHVVYT